MDCAPLAAATLGTVVGRPGLEPGEAQPLDLQSRPLPATEYRPKYIRQIPYTYMSENLDH